MLLDVVGGTAPLARFLNAHASKKTMGGFIYLTSSIGSLLLLLSLIVAVLVMALSPGYPSSTLTTSFLLGIAIDIFLFHVSIISFGYVEGKMLMRPSEGGWWMMLKP